MRSRDGLFAEAERFEEKPQEQQGQEAVITPRGRGRGAGRAPGMAGSAGWRKGTELQVGE